MPVYSHSRLSRFEKCPQSYKFRYIDGITSSRETIEAFLGSRVHEVLERLYRDVQMGKIPSLEEVIQIYTDLWKKRMHADVVVVREEYHETHYFEVGRRCLEGYHRRFAPFDQSKTLGLEKRIEVLLDPRREYRLQGYIDRLAFVGDGVYEIHDYKTSRDVPINPGELEDRQLGLYELGLREASPAVKEVRLIWHFLTQEHDIVITTTEPYLKNLREETIELIRRVERETEFSPKVSALCRWCEYAAICPAKKHEMATAALGPGDFLKEDGVRLANEYAEADRSKRALEEKMALLRERILGYAQAQGVTTIQGSGCRVTRYGGPKTKFITASESEARYHELVDSVKRYPELWERVADLDEGALLELYNRDDIPTDLREALKGYLVTRGGYWLRLKYLR